MPSFDRRVVYPAKAKPKKVFPRKAVYGLLFLGALPFAGIGAWYLLNLPFFRAERIEIRGEHLLAASDIEQTVRELLGGRYLGLVPRDSLFFISVPELERELAGRYSAIAAVSVERAFPNRLAVDVTERELWGIYCVYPAAASASGSAAEGGGERQCFYLDTRGMAYERLFAVRGWLLPLVYASRPVRAGDQAVVPLTLRYYTDAGRTASGIGAHILSMRLATATPEDIRFDLAEGWYLLVNASRPVSDWGGVLGTVLEQEIGERRGELEYMDLRFGNKVFYKFR